MLKQSAVDGFIKLGAQFLVFSFLDLHLGQHPGRFLSESLPEFLDFSWGLLPFWRQTKANLDWKCGPHSSLGLSWNPGVCMVLDLCRSFLEENHDCGLNR